MAKEAKVVQITEPLKETDVTAMSNEEMAQWLREKAERDARDRRIAAEYLRRNQSRVQDEEFKIFVYMALGNFYLRKAEEAKAAIRAINPERKRITFLAKGKGGQLLPQYAKFPARFKDEVMEFEDAREFADPVEGQEKDLTD